MKKQANLTTSPTGALKRIEAAATSDLDVARLTLGLFATLNPHITDASRKLFPDYKGGLTACRHFPISLQNDLRSLVEWALAPQPGGLDQLISCAARIEKAVRRIRTHSPLGRQFQRRAKRLMKLHPEFPKKQWGPWGQIFHVMPEAIGKPLSEGIIKRAAAFGARHLQIVLHRAYMNSAYMPGVLSIRLGEDRYTVETITLAVKTPADEDGPQPRRVEGPLLDYFETGTEGIVWTIASDERTGHAALEPILEGDHLTVLDRLGATLWSGTIRCDRKVGWRRYPMNPKYGQQCALGYWVHWIQKGFRPDDWARFFVRPEYDRLRGVLRRKRDQRTRYVEQK